MISDEREAVPFGVETRAAFIAVDIAALDVGLVAIPRVAAGHVGDLPTDLAAAVADGAARRAGAPGHRADVGRRARHGVRHVQSCATGSRCSPRAPAGH